MQLKRSVLAPCALLQAHHGDGVAGQQLRRHQQLLRCSGYTEEGKSEQPSGTPGSKAHAAINAGAQRRNECRGTTPLPPV